MCLSAHFELEYRLILDVRIFWEEHQPLLLRGRFQRMKVVSHAAVEAHIVETVMGVLRYVLREIWKLGLIAD